MVDFKKRLAKKKLEKPLDPSDIYDRLDRASDKGPLRPAQVAVLEKWHGSLRDTKDVILKLHTGQGKTLIGLLMLQSKMNENKEPAVYLCPNRFLVNQTVSQAAQFGVNCVTADRDLPAEFLDGKAILIASVQKLFNGRSKFGLGPNSVSVGTVLIDDAHACIDAIRSQCVIELGYQHAAYAEIVDLFAPDLEEQGVGTFADLRRYIRSALLPVPYWAWSDREVEVATILSKHAESNEVKFAWPLLKDMIGDCLCIVSGETLEIAPYQPPLQLFGSYHKADHRVFMSATVTDDSFLIKGLGLGEDVVSNPLVYEQETWAGEKMVLIPSLIDPSLSDSEIVNQIAKPVEGRKFGIVVLCPSFESCERWKTSGATSADSSDIDEKVEQLRNGKCDEVLAVANRYDGIDLPDDSCRVLVFDSKPFAESLQARYLEGCREGSDVVATRVARSIEQGLGRSVRGEKDYCVILLIGANLIKAIRTEESRRFFSPQTAKQIEIGLAIADLAKEDIADGTKPTKALRDLIQQCLRRDDGWKGFYVEQMNEVQSTKAQPKALGLFAAELRAEIKYAVAAFGEAAAIIQDLIDESISDDSDKGWYLQEMARYTYRKSKNESNKLQVSAHRLNRYLLKPKSGMVFSKLETLSQKRIENVIGWITTFGSYEELVFTLDEVLGHLRFGVKADLFEKAFNDLAAALGFVGQRPDKEWKEGPDNLWALRKGDYLLAECKSKVQLTREYINKDETGQMNNACAWFGRQYGDAEVKRIMIIPTKKLGPGAGFNDEVAIMRKGKLGKLTKNVRLFFSEFANLDLQDLSAMAVQELITAHGLSVDDIVSTYSERVRPV